MNSLNPLKLSFLAVIATGLPIVALADNVETAKFVTEDAFPVDAGSTELEFAYQYVTADSVFDNNGNVSVRGDLSGQIITAKASHGIGEGLDVSVQVAWRDMIEDADNQISDGIGNVTVSAKWMFYQNSEKGLAVGWVPGFTAPIAGDAVSEKLTPGQDYWSVNNLLVLTYVVDAFNLNVDIGHFLPVGDNRDEQRDEFIGDIAVGWQLNSWMQLAAELNFGHATVSRGNGSVNRALTVGAVMTVDDSMRLDIGQQTVEGGRNAEKFTIWLVNFSKTF
jgi:hypothetical protein